MFRLTGGTARARVNMKICSTVNYLATAVFSVVSGLMIMAGALLYMTVAAIDVGTDTVWMTDNAILPYEFDPDVLPAPGTAKGNKSSTRDCKDMTYHAPDSSTRYVRGHSGIHGDAIGRYRPDYGYLQFTANRVPDPHRIMKLGDALGNCDEIYRRSGKTFFASSRIAFMPT